MAKYVCQYRARVAFLYRSLSQSSLNVTRPIPPTIARPSYHPPASFITLTTEEL